MLRFAPGIQQSLQRFFVSEIHHIMYFLYLKFNGARYEKTVIVLALLILPFHMLLAHPPTEMNCKLKILSNNLNQDEIALFIVHDQSQSAVTDRRVHFIKTITVQVNGQLTNTFSYTRQSENLLRHLIRIKKVKTDDVILITAICSTGGQMTQEIIVTEQRRR